MNFEAAAGVLIVLALVAVLAFLTFVWWLVRKMLRTARLSAPKKIMLGGCLLFLLCGLFPPWLYREPNGHVLGNAGYDFILTPPESRTSYGIYTSVRYSKLDGSRLCVEWLCILAATGMGLVLFGKSGRGEGKAAELADSDKHAATTPPPATETIEAATSQPTAKPEPPSPSVVKAESPSAPTAKTKRSLWMTLTSLVCLAIIAISLVVWLVSKPKPESRTDKLPTWDETSPVDKPIVFGNAAPTAVAETNVYDQFDAPKEPAPVRPAPTSEKGPWTEYGPAPVRPAPASEKGPWSEYKPSPVRPLASTLTPAAAKRITVKPNVFDQFDRKEAQAPGARSVPGQKPNQSRKPPKTDEFGGKLLSDADVGIFPAPFRLNSFGHDTGHMTEVEIAGVGLIYFPADMFGEQVLDVLRRKIGSVRDDKIKAKLDLEFTPLKTATNQWRYFPTSRGP
jgi:flagellar basal body-associated protein FliL